jgi:acetyl esterase/lipase
VIEHRVGVSREAEVVQTVSKVFARPCLKYLPLRGPVRVFWPLLDRSAALIPRLPGTTHKPIQARTWRGELVTPLDGPTSEGAILYLHGGAFLMCGTATHRRIVERLARKTGMAVLSVDYRQLPSGRLHDSISDCEDAFAWLVRQGHSASKIVLAGDSAGGHLAFATALRIRDDGVGVPAGIVGLSPWLDFDHMAKIRHHNARRDAYIPARRLRQVARLVVGSHPELHHSPVNADLHGLPPTLIICAEGEILRVDAELMADRLAAAGVPCTLQVWEGQVHAFPVLSDLTPEARAAVQEVVTFVQRVVAAPAYVPGRDGTGPAAASSTDVA